jgi:hypothetical protein
MQQVMEGNALARAGMKKVGVSPFNPNWVKMNAAAFKPSEVYKTNGDQALMGAICRDMPDVHTLTDARHILTAKRSLAAMQDNPESCRQLYELLGTTKEDLESLMISVRLGEHANNPINGVLAHPWWQAKLEKMGEIPAEPNGEGTGGARRGSHYESRAAGLVLNSPERLALMVADTEAKELDAFLKEAERLQKAEEQAIITNVLLGAGDYLDDDFDCDTDTVKADVVKKFIKKNNVNKRDDYIEACLQSVPPRTAGQGLLHPANLLYLRSMIESNEALDQDSEDRINWM